jgi:hypothetical protein
MKYKTENGSAEQNLWMFFSSFFLFSPKKLIVIFGAFNGFTPSKSSYGKKSKAKQRFQTPRGTACIRAGESFFFFFSSGLVLMRARKLGGEAFLFWEI